MSFEGKKIALEPSISFSELSDSEASALVRSQELAGNHSLDLRIYCPFIEAYYDPKDMQKFVMLHNWFLEREMWL